MYYIKAIVLENCPYSIAASELLTKLKIPNEILNINYDNKNKYKNENIDTFPQIYLVKKNSNGHLLLGGYDDLNNFIENYKSQKISDKNIELFMNKYKWSKKATLRLIQLINL